MDWTKWKRREVSFGELYCGPYDTVKGPDLQDTPVDQDYTRPDPITPEYTGENERNIS